MAGRDDARRSSGGGGVNPVALMVTWLAITVLVGFRYSVGGDWKSYADQYAQMRGATFADALSHVEPGYSLINWVSDQLDLGIAGVNVMAAAIFAYGLIVFCNWLPRPWIAICVAMPYLIIVVAMGYTRQGIAIGFVMAGLVALARGSNIKFILFVTLAITVHKSAIVMFPMAALVNSKSRAWALLWSGGVCLALFYVFVADSAENAYRGYISAEMQSQGALVRLGLNALAGGGLIYFRSQIVADPVKIKLFSVMSFLSLLFFALFFVTNVSTALDRVGLYLLPLQLVFFSYLPDLIAGRALTEKNSRFGSKFGKHPAPGWVVPATAGFYGLVLFIWLNFSNYAFYWLPYRWDI